VNEKPIQNPRVSLLKGLREMKCKKILTVYQKIQHLQKVTRGSSVLTRESLNQTTKINNPAIPPKLLEEILADPSIIIVIWQTCIKWFCEEV
jgi:hypothetical protein